MESVSYIDHSFSVILVAKLTGLTILWLLAVVAWPKISRRMRYRYIRRRKVERLDSGLRLIHDPNFKKRLYRSTITEEPTSPDHSVVFQTSSLQEEIPLSLNGSCC